MGSNDMAAQVGNWLRDGMLRGDPVALVAALVLGAFGGLLGQGL